MKQKGEKGPLYETLSNKRRESKSVPACKHIFTLTMAKKKNGGFFVRKSIQNAQHGTALVNYTNKHDPLRSFVCPFPCMCHAPGADLHFSQKPTH